MPGTSNYVGIDWAHTFNDHFLNQARYSYARSTTSFEGGGFASCTSAAILTGCPIRVDFNDGQTLSLGENPAWPQGRIVTSHQVQDNISWQAGKHFLKLGGEYNHYPESDTGLPNVNGDLRFDNFGAYINTAPTVTLYAEGPAAYNLVFNYGAVYLQDDWKASGNLTLSLGLRYEIQSQPLNSLHALTVQRETNPAYRVLGSVVATQSSHRAIASAGQAQPRSGGWFFLDAQCAWTRKHCGSRRLPHRLRPNLQQPFCEHR